MKRILQLTLLLLLITSTNYAQDAAWRYDKELKAPAEDSLFFQPFLTTMDVNGRFYVASSNATNLNGHNAIYYADSTDLSLKKLIDFTAIGDTVKIGTIRGFACAGTDIFVVASQNFAAVGNTVATLYRIRNADTNTIEKFGFNLQGSGYGTHLHGISLTKDTILYSGITYQTSIRLYNFNSTVSSPSYGSYLAATYGQEPGGAHTNGFDIIRDLAVSPVGDYTSPETPFYTSRNSKEGGANGGLAIWTGGDQVNPGNYVGVRIADANSQLSWQTSIPYGIYVDHENNLWAAGTDSTKRWVKAFKVMVAGTTALAEEVASLPSSTDPVNPDTSGAPFNSPADVVVNKTLTRAYVSDQFQKTVYTFKFEAPNSVENESVALNNFTLKQNYPNPFNPATMISFSLNKAQNVKLVVTNSLGQEIATLLNGFMQEGQHSQIFKANDLPSGIYFYTLTTSTGSISKKMMLIK